MSTRHELKVRRLSIVRDTINTWTLRLTPAVPCVTAETWFGIYLVIVPQPRPLSHLPPRQTAKTTRRLFKRYCLANAPRNMPSLIDDTKDIEDVSDIR